MTACVQTRGWKFPKGVYGWLTQREGEALRDLATGKTVLEIGSCAGRSTICMAQVAKVVHAVDWHKGDPGAGLGHTLHQFLGNLEAWRVLDRVVVYAMSTAQAWRLLPVRCFDLVFVDGDHREEAVRNDTRLAFRCVKEGGAIAWHDFGYPSVRNTLAGMIPDDGRNQQIGSNLLVRHLSEDE